MQALIHDMLIWLATFFGVSLLLVLAIRFGLRKVRLRRVDRLKDIESRCRLVPEELGLPLTWRSAPAVCDAPGYRRVQTLRWMVPLALIAGGVMWSATGKDGWNWNGLGFAISLGCLVFVGLTVWLNWRRETTMPRHSRQLALALRCWAVRISAGVACREALDQSARQLRRIDPEIARHLELAAVAENEGDQLQRAFYPCGTGLAERLAGVLAGKVSDGPTELRHIAHQLDNFYLTQSLARTRLIENWLKYPLALCLVPALNLIVFSPAITDLIGKFGNFRLPDAQLVQPLEPIPQSPEEIPPAPN